MQKQARQRLPIDDIPEGDFRFHALDVETANYQRYSICQIGVAFVRPDNTISTWVTYVDPQTTDWSCSRIHGITARTVSGAPTFEQVYPLLEEVLCGHVVFQHSRFDETAMAAACERDGLQRPSWIWRDSVQVARRAWPELKGRGGHGLASLKRHLGLDFVHHDAGEDARASAEVVLRAEAVARSATGSARAEAVVEPHREVRKPSSAIRLAPTSSIEAARRIGIATITQGNLESNHIYLRPFFEKFPADTVGGSNRAQAAAIKLSIEWGGSEPVSTDLDGTKKLFRKRAWIAEFFKLNQIVAGSVVAIDEVGERHFRVSVVDE
ncbi:3'-5' exonuclease [Bosea sp. NPDC003192]|uniref:3'-5' exonuclease n=1 Tax=Bosea sp. NPDC003192 TaxID=3390551 RepID=UPI003CFF32A5